MLICLPSTLYQYIDYYELGKDLGTHGFFHQAQKAVSRD